jgi:hypothetical protein
MANILAEEFMKPVMDDSFRNTGTIFSDSCGSGPGHHLHSHGNGKKREYVGFCLTSINNKIMLDIKLNHGLQDKWIGFIGELCTYCTGGRCKYHNLSDFIICSLAVHGQAWPYVITNGVKCTLGTYSGVELIKFKNHHVLLDFNDNRHVDVVLIALKRSEWDSEELEWLASSGLVHVGPIFHEKESADSVSAEHLDRKVGYDSDDEEYNSDDEFENERNEASLGHYDGDSSPVPSVCGDEIRELISFLNKKDKIEEKSDAPIKDTTAKVSVTDRIKALDKKVATLPQSGISKMEISKVDKVGTREFFGRIQKENGTFCSVFTNSETDKELLNEQYGVGMVLENGELVEVMMLKETV